MLKVYLDKKELNPCVADSPSFWEQVPFQAYMVSWNLKYFKFRLLMNERKLWCLGGGLPESSSKF